MKCLRCNNEINNNSKFCEYCGNKVESNINMTNNQIYNNNSSNQNNMINSNLNSNAINANNIENNQYMNTSNNTDFKTWEGVTNLFRSVNCIGNQNIIFIARKNSNSATTSSMIFGGAIGGMASSMERTAGAGFKIGIGEYDALIINVTEKGFGFIPLQLQGKRLTKWTMDKMLPNMSNFVFVGNEYVKSFEVKKFSIFSNKSKRLIIKVEGNVTFDLIANLDEQFISYQNNSMNALINMYSKK